MSDFHPTNMQEPGGRLGPRGVGCFSPMPPYGSAATAPTDPDSLVGTSDVLGPGPQEPQSEALPTEEIETIKVKRIDIKVYDPDDIYDEFFAVDEWRFHPEDGIVILRMNLVVFRSIKAKMIDITYHLEDGRILNRDGLSSYPAEDSGVVGGPSVQTTAIGHRL